jgi:hypothetical protein
MYDTKYFIKRGHGVDTSEWRDIEAALKTACVDKRKHVILDIGGGTGGLARWLRSRGWNANWCDPYAPAAPRCSLPDNVPRADVYVLQHVLEHVGDPARGLASLLEKKPVAVIAVVPGHLSDDETHECNHFRPGRSASLAGRWGVIRVCGLDDLMASATGYHAYWYPDSRSLREPWLLDYVFIAARRIKKWRLWTRLVATRLLARILESLTL